MERARELVSSPSTWTRGADARNSGGTGVGPGSPDAVQFCSQGALQRAIMERVGITGHRAQIIAVSPIPRATEETMRLYREAYRRVDAIAHDKHNMGIISVNDDFGREAALECFDLAIQRFKRDMRFKQNRPRYDAKEIVGLATIVKAGDLAVPTTPKVATFKPLVEQDVVDPELERLLMEANKVVDAAAEGLADKVLASV